MNKKIFFGSVGVIIPFGNNAKKNLPDSLRNYLKQDNFSSDFFLSDFKNVTLTAEAEGLSYLFSMTTTSEILLEKTISDVKDIISKYVMEKIKRGQLRYNLIPPKQIHFEFIGIIPRKKSCVQLYRLFSKKSVPVACYG